MRRPLALAALVLVTGLWIAALVTAPLVEPWNGGTLEPRHPGTQAPRHPGTQEALSSAVYAAGSLVCHQRPDRSFHVDGAQLPVCARCLGLYVGGLGGALAWAWFAGVGRRARPRADATARSQAPRRALVLAAIPTIATVATATLGWWDPDNVVRALAAVPLGTAIGGCLAAAAAGDLG